MANGTKLNVRGNGNSGYDYDGTIDDTLIGYTMTSDAERCTPIDDGK